MEGDLIRLASKRQFVNLPLRDQGGSRRVVTLESEPKLPACTEHFSLASRHQL